MGLFTPRPQHEQQEWAGLPSEPLDPQSAAERLDAAPAADPTGIGLAAGSTSIVFPVAPPAPEAADAATAAPPDPDDAGGAAAASANDHHPADED